MYYSVTQVCRCNEETRTNSSETSLTGQPLYDTSTNELYIGDGETTIQNLSPIQNLKAGSGMTYTNGSVSLNEGTQTNAGGIKVWAENNDVYYSTPNGVGAQLFPIIRTYHPGYNQTHPNYHTLSGTASTQYDTGEKTPHNDDISITLNYKGTTEGVGSATGRATGNIYCNSPEYDLASGTHSEYSYNKQINAGESYTDPYIYYVVSGVKYQPGFTVYSTGGQAYGDLHNRITIEETVIDIRETNDGYLSVGMRVSFHNGADITLTVTGFSISFSARKENGNYSGSDDYDVGDVEVTSIGTPIIAQHGAPITPVDAGTTDLTSIGIIRTRVTMNRITTVQYVTPFEYVPSGYLYEGTATKNIGDDAESVSVSPSTPDDTTASVEYSGSTATITANCVSPTNVGSSITRGVTLSYNTPVYGYYTNVSTYIGSDYGARVTSTSPSVTSYSSGTSGSYFWVNMRAASQTSVSASAVSYWDSWVPAYNSYHYPIELNGVRHNFNTIDLDGVNYAATAEKYNKR